MSTLVEKSRPPWARELKRRSVMCDREHCKSRPPWARELKLSSRCAATLRGVAPPVGA